MPTDDPGASDAYDEAFERVMRRLPALREEVRRNRALVEERYADLIDSPDGRHETLLRDSAPSTLLALSHDLMRRSYAARFDDPRRCLALARRAVEAVERLAETDYLSEESKADLRAEALLHLGNAQRIGSDLRAAEDSLREADVLLQLGTRDQLLRAQLFSFFGSLRFAEGRLEEAGRAFRQETHVRRLIGDSGGLGSAFVNRGVVASAMGSLSEACDLLREGVRQVEEARIAVLALTPLAESLARSGYAAESWKVISRAEAALGLLGEHGLEVRVRWVRGVSCFALGQLGRAETTLLEVRRALRAQGRSLQEAMLSMDLACVLAAQGRFSALRKLAAEVHEAFLTEGLERRALDVFLMFYRKVRQGEASVDLVVDVTNFLARFQYDRDARFEPREGA